MSCHRLLLPALLAACLFATACAHQDETGTSTAPPPMAEPKAPVETAPPAETAPPVVDTTPVACTDPRPQACTMDYRPVCATRDTGIRCVTTPCPSSEQKTFGNACSACGDPKVSQYVKGECPAG